MHADQRFLQSALNHARSMFAAAVECMAVEAERSLSQSLSVATGERRATLGAARQVLLDDGKAMVARLSALYSGLLERAVDTMYGNQRPSLAGLTADSLSLIDDETVNRQIELDRLVSRLREVDLLSLGRLNVLIAQIHGEADARERENPFRPYLLARAVHDGVWESTPKAHLAAALFDRLAQAMPEALAEFYSSIYGVFESSGVQARLQAVPSRFANTAIGSRLPRSTGFGDSGFGSVPQASGASSLLPVTPATRHDTLRVILAAMRANQPGNLVESESNFPQRLDAALVRLPEPLRRRLHHRRIANPESAGDDILSGWLNRCRRRVRQQQPGPLPEALRLRVMRRELPPESAGEAADLLFDLVASLFDWVDAEGSLASSIRHCIVRLELPFLQTALHAPDLLLDASHPLRELIDLMGAVAYHLPESSLVGKVLTEEAVHAVEGLLDPETDPAHEAAHCLSRFRQRVAERLPDAEPGAVACLAALAAIRTSTRIRLALSSALSSTMAPLDLDVEAARFLADAVSRTVARRRAGTPVGRVGREDPPICPSGSEPRGQTHQAADEAALLAELVWSLLPKSSIEDRSRLRSRLPGLIRGLRATLQDSGLPGEAIVAGMDRLMEVHGRVLCGPLAELSLPCACLDALRARFAAALEPLPAVLPAAQSILLQRVPVGEAELGGALSEHGAAASLFLTSCRPANPVTAGNGAGTENSILVTTMPQPGTGYTLHDAGAEVPVRLIWIDADRCFSLFLPEFGGTPLLFSDIALQDMLACGRLTSQPNASLLERAISDLSSEAAVPA